MVYSVEAPESRLEDFGTGTLRGGKADVKIDDNFAAVARTAPDEPDQVTVKFICCVAD